MYLIRKIILFALALVLLGVNLEANPSKGNKEIIKKEAILKVAPWNSHAEPIPLPKNWKKHRAKYDTIAYYGSTIIPIPKGDIYFTYKDKVALGWHGTYNPPRGM